MAGVSQPHFLNGESNRDKPGVLELSIVAPRVPLLPRNSTLQRQSAAPYFTLSVPWTPNVNGVKVLSLPFGDHLRYLSDSPSSTLTSYRVPVSPPDPQQSSKSHPGCPHLLVLSPKSTGVSKALVSSPALPSSSLPSLHTCPWPLLPGLRHRWWLCL